MSQTRTGYRRNASGLLGAILAALALMLAFWGMARLVNHDAETPVRVVDYAASLQSARAQAPFDVLAPAPAPSGWRATSVEWSGAGPEAAWHLGFLTSQDDYVGLEQGNAASRAFIAASTPADQPAQPVEIGGVIWGSLVSADGVEHALVLEEGEVTTVVTGTAAESELVAFAGTLSTE